jgi:hypothetical protein
MTSLLSRLKSDRTLYGKATIIALAVLIMGYIGYTLPGGDDLDVFMPATRLLLAGKSPYNEPMFFTPVWTLLPFIPLTVLPPLIGRAILFIVILFSFAYSAWRFGAKPVAIVAFLLSPPVIMTLWLSSIDWIPILGFVLPPQIGLFFVATKPQMGSVVALFWLVEAFRTGGTKKVIKIFWPITAAILLTFVFFGLWPLQASNRDIVNIGHNSSLWPVSIPVGLGLLVATFHKRNISYAMAASPCLSPYVMATSWSGAFMAILLSVPETIAAVIGAWILVAIRMS